jgi:hypothetical protein
VQRLAARRIEGREELVLELADDRTDPGELYPARIRDADHMAAAVVGVALPHDRAALLE